MSGLEAARHDAWEQGYEAAVDDIERRSAPPGPCGPVDPTPNPYAAGVVDAREAELIAKATPEVVFDEAMAARQRLAERQAAERGELRQRHTEEREVEEARADADAPRATFDTWPAGSPR